MCVYWYIRVSVYVYICFQDGGGAGGVRIVLCFRVLSWTYIRSHYPPIMILLISAMEEGIIFRIFKPSLELVRKKQPNLETVNYL